MGKHRALARGDSDNAANMMRKAIHDRDVFSALVRHERNRCDRSDTEFSLAVFEVGSERDRRAKVACASIIKLMRSIDAAGWLGDQSIGVLLASTPAEGAYRFAARVADGSLRYKIFTYPSNWMPEYRRSKEDSDDQDGPRGGSPEDFSLKTPIWKRSLDVSGSLFGILLLWPLFLLVGLFIKAVSPGPVFFKQYRVGKGGRLFNFIKFRTMKYGNDQATHQAHILARMKAGDSLQKLDDVDPRIIPGGRFLRKSCIDELPQLFNVLMGDMSLVGPRPCLAYEAREYQIWYGHRFDSLPGMTGLWQVSGKNKLTLLQMIRLDIAYMENLSFKNDLAIILRTLPAIFSMMTESMVPKLLARFNLKPEEMRDPRQEGQCRPSASAVTSWR